LAKEIMIPRQDIICLYAEESMTENLTTINHSRHTRYPLCEEDKDHVLGLVHIKDVLDLRINRRNNLRLINRPILKIPEIMPVSKLLQLMRARRTYLAIVVDEYGSTVGLVSLEDIMEELVGTIRNEHTAEKEEIQRFMGKFQSNSRGNQQILLNTLEFLIEQLLDLQQKSESSSSE